MLRWVPACLLIVLLAATLLTTPTAQAQTTWYVDDDAPGDPGPGTGSISDPNEDGSAEHPFDTIREAFAASSDGDMILIADGRYAGGNNRNLNFLGKAVTVRSQNGPEHCTIDCRRRGIGFMFVSGETASSVLDGVTITNALTSQRGAGIRCEFSWPTITNCMVVGNEAASGAGISSSGGGPTISHCMFARNIATDPDSDGGGAVYLHNSDALIMSCLIRENSATNLGGAILCSASAPTIVNCSIMGNNADDGGAIYAQSNSSLTTTNSTIAGNTVDGSGRAVGCEGSTAIVTNCIVWNNEWQAFYGDVVACYSDVEDGWPGEGNIDVDPGFAFSDDFHVMPGSPCIDVGTNEPPGGLVADDLDGNDRPLDGDGDMLAVADMGAYEFNADMACIAVSPPAFDLCAYEGGPGPATQILSVRNSGGSTLNWEIGVECDWLTGEPASGESIGEVDEVSLFVDTTDMTMGVYDCDLTVFDTETAAIPRTVRITVQVGTAFRVPSEYATIQEAINATESLCDTVLLADGTYTGEGNKNLDFGGRSITVRSENGPVNCVIDCENNGRGFYFHSDEGPEAVVDGVTITRGNTNWGGAIFCNGGEPTIVNCVLTENVASSSGGAIYGASHLTIEDCVIAENAAEWDGGGIYCPGAATITGCTVRDNRAYSGGGISSDGHATILNCTVAANLATYRNGGGIACGDDATVANCTIRANRAAWEGGGISCDGDATITGCTVSANHASWDGGGIAFDHCSSTIVGSTIAGNSTSEQGGGIFCNDADLVVLDSVIRDNTSFWEGGGVYSVYTHLTLLNCLIRDNTSLAGGALCVHDGQCTVTHCTVTRNTSWEHAGVYARHGGSLAVANSILWADAPGEAAVDDTDSTVAMSYSDVQGGWPGEGNIDRDPLFVLDDDLHLAADSPGIDTGTNQPPGGLPATDFEGNMRSIDGDGDLVAVADMGAYEFDPNLPSIAVSPTHIEFAMIENEVNPDAKTLQIRNCGGGVLDWEVAEDCSWLAVEPPSGQSSGEVDEAILFAEGTGLAHGLHECVLYVRDPEAANTPRAIPVSLRVNRVYSVPIEHATIQDAIDATTLTGDVVLVENGTYTGPGNKNLDFHGKDIVVRSANGPENCIIDCEGGGRGFYFHSGERPATTVDGLTITNGYVEDYPDWDGGAIHCESSRPTVTNCIIRENYAAGTGGGISCIYAGPNIIGCTITGNATGSAGGGVRCTYQGNAVIRGCTIAGNTVSQEYGGWGGGGGVFCNGASPMIDNCEIASNTSADQGGGISCRDEANPVITGCTIMSNTAMLEGGGVACSDESGPVIADCAIASNVSGEDGGGIAYDYCCRPLVANCTILSNTSGEKGGGVFCRWSDVTILDCTIADNTAVGTGGGIHCRLDSTPLITNCTISSNTAGTTGGGLSSVGGCYPTLTNCTICENVANHGGGVYCRRDAIIVNCAITHNQAAEAGGGLRCAEANPLISNCTLSENTAQQGGGVACNQANPTIVNSILWADYAMEGPEIALADVSMLAVRYSDVQGGELVAHVDDTSTLIWGVGNTDADPLFVDPDGPDDDPNTWEDNDYHLGLRSPCIDAGDNTAVPADSADLDDDGDTDEPVPFDLDGNPRFVDDPATPDGGTGVMPRVDMGAYEFQVMRVSVDIRPGACPNWLRFDDPEVLPMAVVGTPAFDVTQIDPNSLVLRRADGVGGSATPLVGSSGPMVRVEDVATPFDGEPCECHDLKGDGIDDLSMEFATRDVVSELRLNELPGGTWVVWVELVVSGELLDGTRFGGADCVSLVPPVPGSEPPGPGSESDPPEPAPEARDDEPDASPTGQPTVPDASFPAGDSSRQDSDADRRARPPTSESDDANADEDDDAPDTSVMPIIGCGPVSPAFLLATLAATRLSRCR